MRCRIENRMELISAYVLDELDDADKLAFEEHYFECPDCAQDVKNAVDAVVLVEREGHNTFIGRPTRLRSLADRFRASIMEFFRFPWHWPQVVSAAIAFLFVIALPLAYLQFKSEKAGPPAVASNFEKSPAFESLLRQTYQSNEFFSEIYPENEQNFDGEIEFRWHLREEYAESVGEIELRIMDNKEQQKYSYKTTKSEVVFNDLLAPGIYYWVLLNKKEMLYIGNFYVGRK